MKKINERYHHLCVTISTAAAIMSFLALAVSVLALIKSSQRVRVTTHEYDCCNFDDDFSDDFEEDASDEPLAF